jgi:hypothetical protein
MPRSWGYIGLVAFVVLGFSGCVREDVAGSTVTCTNELWVPLVTLLVGVVAGPAGWYLRQKSGRLGWGLMILSPIVVFGFVPSLFMDKAVVDDNHFSVRTGIWGMTAVHDVTFNELSRVRAIGEERTGKYGRKSTSYFLLCERKDGTSAKVPLGNKVVEAAAVHFVERVHALKIPLQDETGQGAF